VLQTFGLRRETNDTLVVDHINNEPLDNRFSNLRWATLSENGMNTKTWATNTSGVKGVAFVPSRNRYQALIQHHGQKQFLGYFKTLDEAAHARREAEIKYFGAFCPQENSS
jgi:hypothetical protein